MNPFRRIAVFAFVIIVFVVLGCVLHHRQSTAFSLRIIHTSDVHSHILPFNAQGIDCAEEQTQISNCFGGVAKQATVIAEARKSSDATILLDAGDQFQGSLFYTQFKGEVIQHFMNRLEYNAMTLGNHEFDDGPEQVGRFIRALHFPVVVANMDAEAEPALNGLIKPYVILRVKDKPVGVIGVLTEETATRSHPGQNITFTKPKEAVNKAVQQLTEKGVQIVIVLSHQGLELDRKMAASTSGIDVIVSAHSHTLLSNDDPDAEGSYPLVVQSPEDKPVIIVSAGANGKHIGELNVSFNTVGVPTYWWGNTKLLDRTVIDDPQIVAEARTYRHQLEQYSGVEIGTTATELQAANSRCRFSECSLGNAATDALRTQSKDSGVQIAFLNGGSFRASIPQGKITLAELLQAMPFTDSLAICQISGSRIIQALEHGVSSANNPQSDGTGQFLQVSGLRYSWDASKPRGKRVTDVYLTGLGDKDTPLALETTYTVALNNFIASGGDRFEMLKSEDVHCYDSGRLLTAVFADYIRQQLAIDAKTQGRITRID